MELVFKASCLHPPLTADQLPIFIRPEDGTRDPLEIPITTVNFRRFMAQLEPLNWFRTARRNHRVEKGPLITSTADYAFVCE